MSGPSASAKNPMTSGAHAIAKPIKAPTQHPGDHSPLHKLVKPIKPPRKYPMIPVKSEMMSRSISAGEVGENGLAVCLEHQRSTV